MKTLIRREFIVPASADRAWRHLARVEQWPTWAAHIRRIELQPAGELGAGSTGVIHLSNGVCSAFTMTEFNPPHNWKWAGPFLWLKVHYDHVFEPAGPDAARLTWIVEAEGFGVSLLGPLFAFIYNRNLDRAIPRLTTQMAEG